MSTTTEIASAFIQGAPPGELQDVVNDIQSLTSDTDPTLISKLKPAFQKYNEDQLATTKLPGGSQSVSLEPALEEDKALMGRPFRF
jgi:capping protein (actin filament) muscle Z-line, alpha